MKHSVTTSFIENKYDLIEKQKVLYIYIYIYIFIYIWIFDIYVIYRKKQT